MTAYDQKRVETCEWCAKGYELDEEYGNPSVRVHMLADASEPRCTAPTLAEFAESMAARIKEMEALAPLTAQGSIADPEVRK